MFNKDNSRYNSEPRFAVVGNPVSHSLSPVIFSHAFLQLGIRASYVRYEADSVESILTEARQKQWTGFNVTSPFKEQIMASLRNIDELARRLGAVNTVLLNREGAQGFNTDPQGVQGLLNRHSIACNNKKFLVLGAGGAAKSAAWAIGSQGGHVTICSRNLERAKCVANIVTGHLLDSSSLTANISKYDCVISCLPRGVIPIETKLISQIPVFVDANYLSPFVAEVHCSGGLAIDGLDWLIYQALAAFKLFTGQELSYEIAKAAISQAANKKE